ncbi:MAG: DNA repair protein RecO [Sedimentisphaerales bacterium]|nr:DNA repair protein RecO [Sedimentisphaerales bacterium]
MIKKDTSVCIRTVDYSETSQIVSLFTRDSGVISAIAKGSKRPKSSFDGPIELFAAGRIVYSEPSKERLATLTEFQQQIPFSFLTRNLYSLHCASLAAELLNLMTEEHDPHPDLFDAFIKFLKNIEQSENALPPLVKFQQILLKEIGLSPILDHCINCKTRYEIRLSGVALAKTEATSDDFYFSNEANGLVCRDCEASFPDKIPVTKTALDCLTNVKTLGQANKNALKEAERLLVSYFTYNLGKQPKMAKYVLSNKIQN